MSRAQTVPSPPGRTSASRRNKDLDNLVKRAGAIDRGGLLALILTAKRCAELGLPPPPLRYLRQHPTEMPRGRVQADDLFEMTLGSTHFLVHPEYQKRPDQEMPQRVVDYEAAIWRRHGKQVLSLVLNVLTSQRQAARMVHVKLGPWSRIGWLEVALPREVKLWPKRLNSPLGILLRALMGELTEGALRACMGELRRVGVLRDECRELVELLSFLLDLKTGGDGSRYRKLNKRIMSMLKLEDSWIWQDGQEQGLEQGLEQGETRATLRSIHKYWNLRFGTMPRDLASQLAAVPTSAELERIQDALFQAADKAAAQAALGARSRPRGRRLSNGKHA